MSDDDTAGQQNACTLCGDDAAPAVVVCLDTAPRMAVVETKTCREIVALDLVGDVRPGDTLLIHHGFAIARLDR